MTTLAEQSWWPGLLLALAAVSFSLPLFSSSEARAQDKGVTWQSLTLEEALSEAGQKDSIVMVDVYATWCGPCHKLDRETFPDPDVARATRDFVAFKIDGETKGGEALREQYNVVGFPTVLFIGADGEEIDRIFGFVDAPTFASMASGFARGEGTLGDLETQYAATPDDDDLLEDLAMRHIVRGNETRALALVESLLSRNPDNADLHGRMHYSLGRYLYLRGRQDYELARTYFEEMERRWPDSRWTARSNYDHAVALLKGGYEDQAFERMQAYVDGAPEENKAGAYNTAAWFSFKNNARLDWGADMAEKGLELQPNNAGLLDTLAELQHVNGDSASAVATIDKAIALDDDPYFAAQREKFSAGL